MQATLRLLRPALAVLALGLVGRAAAQSGSPFLPPASVAASAAAPGETLEFGGVNVMGAKTLVNVYDKTLKKGRWIEVGGSDGGYSVLAYDPRREQIVVKFGDGQKTLTLRKSTGPVRGPAPVAIMPAVGGFATPDNVAIHKFQPAPPPSAANDPAAAVAVTAPAVSPATPPVEAAPPPKSDAPAKPLTVARQEEEARMLVSDLLEIGMAQRKAYEEAQKKAAAGTTEQPAAAPATTTPGG